VAAALGNMKGVMMKIGQMASYVDESVPEPIRNALADLQQDAPPMAAELAAGVIERELGGPPEKVFAEWDPVPIAAASIGQVHRAITHDDVAVAVKVQYPGVDESIKADLDNYDFFANMFALMFPGADVGPFIDEIRERVGEELDYLHEADNQRMFADFYEGHPFIRIPRVIDELSTARVLTTELATGARFSELDGWSQEERNLAGETIDRFVFRSLYRLHAFNGDPHPGNYLFHGGGVVTFLDFGLVKRFTQPEMDMFERMAETLVVRRDGAAYRALLEEAGVLKPGSGMSDDQIVDYFGYYYDPVMEDREYTFTLEYASEAMKKIMPVGPGTSPEIRKFGNLPPAFGILQRINLGMTAVMAHLAPHRGGALGVHQRAAVHRDGREGSGVAGRADYSVARQGLTSAAARVAPSTTSHRRRPPSRRSDRSSTSSPHSMGATYSRVARRGTMPPRAHSSSTAAHVAALLTWPSTSRSAARMAHGRDATSSGGGGNVRRDETVRPRHASP
jgi:hypothetical protein